MIAPVVIAALTFKRPDDLPELLPLLAREATSVSAEVGVLVVDNDPRASARAVVEETAQAVRVQHGVDVRYVVEAAPGIAAARNRVLDEARGARLLVFIDDDERPHAGWLSHLLQCHETHAAAAVAGAVIPDVGRLTDPWIREGGFFVRQRHATGTRQPAASTANLLLDLSRLEDLGSPRFDPRFGLSGGSDTKFSREIVARGGEIVWCDEAVVVDHIRTARLTRRWVLQRHFRSGNGWSRIEVGLARGVGARTRARLRMTAVGAARVGVGAARATYGRIRGSYRHRARGCRTVARGIGMVSGAWGVRYVEYGRVKGS